MAPPTLFPLSGRRIFVAGHRGMVGSAPIRRLAQEECGILAVGRDAVELRDQAAITGSISIGRVPCCSLPRELAASSQRHPSRRFPVR